MFKRLFRGERDDEPEQSATTAVRDQDGSTDSENVAQAGAVMPANEADDLLASHLAVDTSNQVEAPPAPPQVEDDVAIPPATESQTAAPAALFSRVDEIERTYTRAPQEPQRRSGLRRLFGGEERPVEEIQREERKTEQAVLKTKAGFFGRISEMFNADEPVTEELWEELEELMIMADVGVDTTLDVIERVRRKAEREDLRRASQVRTILKQEMIKLLQVDTRAYVKRPTRPYTILVVGVNGAGKTTLIAKIAHRYHHEIGQTVILAAADTFRAAAVEQLKTWAERIGVPVIAQGQGADPGAVAFDAVQAAHARDADVVIIDTAGRLQSKYNLMQELHKIRNVVQKRVDSAPHEVLLVIDATTGQNGLAQAKAFMEASEVTHLALTKLDGTAKGGIAFAMVQEIKRPIKYIGTGEKVDDLAIFDPEAFVDALFDEEVPA